MSEDDSVKHEGKWTRADLPHWDKIRDADDMAGNGLRSRVIDIALNEVVAHLNTHHPKPEPDKWRAEWVAVNEDLKAARQREGQADEQWKKWEGQARRAEARTDSAVSRADVEKALDTGIRGTTDGGLIDQDTSIPSGECVRLAVDAVCDLFGVKAEQAVDPVEAKARELYGVANAGVSWDAVIKSADEGNRVDREVAREYRAIARHVHGEDHDE